MIGRCLRGNLKELFPLAMMPGVDGFRAGIQLAWDEFSRMRHSLIDPLHFLLFTLFGAGLRPLPAANCQSLLSLEAHIFTNWHLQSWSCFPNGLHHLLVVRCGLLATFSGKRRKGLCNWHFGMRQAAWEIVLRSANHGFVPGNFSNLIFPTPGVKMCL